MSTNISKKKRDDLLDKIKQIRAFIAAAPQDENTGNLLSYLYELEKDVNGKKYGLVFEEHREEIDEVLDTHTPVLTEDADLFIDHGGQMNFLLEGDNLAALKLLEKTHRGKIDLIYIPENLIKEYFKDSQDKAKGKIKRIKIIGTNDAGSFEVDTNITGMKHFLKVKGESVTNEVESSDFFVKAQEFIASMGGRI